MIHIKKNIRKRKIIIIGAWPPPSGGVASYTMDLYYNLLETNFEVGVYAKGEFRSSDNNVKRIYLTPKSPFYTCFSLLRMLVGIPRNSIVHTQSILTTHPDSRMLIFFFLLKKVKKCFLVETLHNATLIERYNQFSGKQKKLYFFIGKLINYLIVVNGPLKDFCISIGIPEEKIVIISSLLPLDYLEVKKENIFSKFEKFAQKFKFIITTAGAFIPLYDLQTIVLAFLKFQEKHKKSGLVILETSFAVDNVYKQKTIELIKNSENILLLQDVSREQVLSIFTNSSLFIRGAQFDSFGLSKAEAILMGTKVISTKAGITNFMEIYDYQNAESLLSVMVDIFIKEKIKIDRAKEYFRKLAKDNFKNIINIYNLFEKKYNKN